MVEPWSGRPKASKTNGPRKFRSFLKKNDITYAAAAEALGVSRPTIHDYVHGLKRPHTDRRNAIEVWTKGAVRAVDWMLTSERKAAASVRPFDE
jgi:transcriptional regulator with XRE-family HTH domain